MKSCRNKLLPWVARYKWDFKVETVSQRCEEGELRTAIETLNILLHRGCHIQDSLLFRVLKRCVAQKHLILGRRVHALAVKSGYESNAFLATHIISMYASHGRLEEATNVFIKVAAPNVFMWHSIICAYTEHGQSKQAINLYWQMSQSRVKPNSYVFVAVLKACTLAGDLGSGKKVHGDILGSMSESHSFVGSSLVDMYSKCGSIDDARRVFDRLPMRDVVTWNAMISGYAHHGLGQEALALYASMQKYGMASADNVTFVCVLKACASVGALHVGKQAHEEIKQRGLEGDLIVSNCLVNMYAKCGSLEDARTVFYRLPHRDAVTWTAMIAGYAQHGFGKEALSLYADMQEDGMVPTDLVTYVCLLQACAKVGALHQGKQLHVQIQQTEFKADIVLGNCLVNMYAKCGSVENAQKVFATMPKKNVVTWNSLLHGYAQHGDGTMAMQCFRLMQQQGIEPNDTTFICLLLACSHAGLVQEGQRLFKMMSEDHGIAPTVAHYSCMVDLLGRSGQLDVAENLLRTTPFGNDVVGWTSLLSACKSHGDLDCGRRCFDTLTTLDPDDASAYVLLASMYANAGRWRDVNSIESLRRIAGAKKKPAKACIEVNRKVHEFNVGDESSGNLPQVKRIGLRLKKEGGHVPHTDLVLKAMSEQDKEDALCGHAEKLALAYGLLNTPNGTALLVTKNLRMCNDCHSSTKILSRLENREIVVRDANRVHRFVGGSCSCGDRH